MSKAQLVITAVALEGRSKSEVARDYGISIARMRFAVERVDGSATGSSSAQPTLSGRDGIYSRVREL